MIREPRSRGATVAAAENIYKYAFAVLEAPDAPDAILLKASANLASTRVLFAAGYCELTSSLSSVSVTPKSYEGVRQCPSSADTSHSGR